jgi:hypothetical protein
MRKFIFTMMLMFSVTLMFSQTDTTQNEYPFFPDRPGFSCNARLVGLHRLDYETSFGYSLNFGDVDGTDGINDGHNLLYNTNLVRFGVAKHLEVRFGMDFGHLSIENESVVQGIKGMSFGVKILIVKDLKYLPDVGILGQINLPKVGNEDYFATPEYSPQLVLLLQKGFGNFLLLGNVGMFYDGFDNSKVQGLYSLDICYNILPTFGTFVEMYRLGSYGNYGDFGFNYFITDNLQVDISCGNKIEEFQNNIIFPKSFYANGGLAWRFPKK